MADRGEPWPADEDVVGRTTLISQRALVVSSLFVALAAGVGVAQALPVPDTAMQRVAWWLVAETAALAAVSAMQLLMRRRRWAAALAPAGLALVIVLTAVAVIIAAPAPEPPRDLVVTLGADTEIGLSPDAALEAAAVEPAAVEAAAVFAPVPVTDPPAPTTVVVAVLPTEPPTTAAVPTSVVGAVVPSQAVPRQAVPTVPTEPPPPPTTTAPPTEPPTTAPPTTVPPTTAPATTAPPTTVAVSAQVLVSLSADRSAPVAANGAKVARGSDIYLFVDPAAAITRVRFWFGSKKGSPDHIENSAPFDLAGSASDGTANPYTVSGTTGSFSITVEVTFASGSISTTKVTLQRV
jgi:hypothetical protein